MRATTVLFALFIGAAFSACTSFDSIDRGVCGNGIVEAGEDCDSADNTCVRCAVTCQTAADCPSGAYTCGTDGLCAAPSGQFVAPVIAGAFQVDDLTVTDIDRDGIGDVLGVSPTSLSVRFGDPNGRLERSQSVLTPPHISAPAFGDIDGDGATDVAYSSQDGLVAYGSRFAALAPLASSKGLINTGDGTTLDIKRIVKLSRRSFVALIDGGPAGAAFVTFDEYSGFTISAPCQQGPTNVMYSELDVGSLEVYNTSETDSVVAIRINAATPRYCMMAFHLDVPFGSKPPQQLWKNFDITPAALPVGTKKLFLADEDFDGNQNCPGIVSEEAGFASVKYWDGTTTAQHCAFDTMGFSPLTASPSPVAADEHIIGRVVLDPGIAFCAHDIIVTNKGLWLYVNFVGITGWGNIYKSTRELTSAISGDLDGDGLGDGALIAANEDDIDIVYRKNDPVNPALPAFILYRIDTTSAVSHATVGDFDGNGAVDLAYDERFNGFDRISVAYDHHDFLSPPVQVATIEAVDDIVPLPIPSTEDASAITTDLFVLQPPSGTQTAPALSILLGSTLGTMIPVIDPRNDDGPEPHDKDITHMSTVVIGKFFANAAAGLHDLLLFAPLDMPPANSSPSAWRLAGAPTGPDGSITPSVPTIGFADCKLTHDAGLCIDSATFLAWPDGGTDKVIAVDTSVPPHAVTFNPAVGSIVASSADALVSALNGKAAVHGLHRADLKGDGTSELVVVANSRDVTSLASGIIVCSMMGATPTSCTDITEHLLLGPIETPQTTCVDAAVIHARFHDRTTPVDTKDDLVLACHDAEGAVLYRYSHDGELGPEYVQLARTSANILAVYAADVTGDGVEDILAIEGDQGVETLVVFPQCSSRNIAACGGGQ